RVTCVTRAGRVLVQWLEEGARSRERRKTTKHAKGRGDTNEGNTHTMAFKKRTAESESRRERARTPIGRFFRAASRLSRISARSEYAEIRNAEFVQRLSLRLSGSQLLSSSASILASSAST